MKSILVLALMLAINSSDLKSDELQMLNLRGLKSVWIQVQTKNVFGEVEAKNLIKRKLKNLGIDYVMQEQDKPAKDKIRLIVDSMKNGDHTVLNVALYYVTHIAPPPKVFFEAHVWRCSRFGAVSNEMLSEGIRSAIQQCLDEFEDDYNKANLK